MNKYGEIDRVEPVKSNGPERVVRIKEIIMPIDAYSFNQLNQEIEDIVNKYHL